MDAKNFMNNMNMGAFGADDMQKFFTQNSGMKAIDWAALIDTNRKNAQMLATIQEISLESWQDMLANTQKITQELVSEQANLLSGFMDEGSPEEKIADAAESLQETYNRAHKQYRALADKQHELSQNMSNIMSKRIKANLKDLKDLLDKDA